MPGTATGRQVAIGGLDNWPTLRPHRQQSDFWRSPTRFNICHSGRRSGKTQIATRRAIRRALRIHALNGRVLIGAPVHAQAVRIYWQPLVQMVPKDLVDVVRVGSHSIQLITGTTIIVGGMDAPERWEGPPLDHALLDEYANMRPEVWPYHIRPMLAERAGTADFIGVPEGRNHYYQLVQQAKHRTKNWRVWHWPSWDILPQEEVDEAREDMDSLIFSQEFGGEFVAFSSMTYYSWNRRLHLQGDLEFDPAYELDLCFDFNIEPGVLAITQEQPLTGEGTTGHGTAVVDEITIEKHSNTERIMDKFCSKYGDTLRTHGRLPINVFGDATGGARSTSSNQGSDWDIILHRLEKEFGYERVYKQVPAGNPAVRSRVNAVNTRLRNADKKVHMKVNAKKCPAVIADFEGVTRPKGGTTSDPIDKKDNPLLSHISDAIGYKVHYLFPSSYEKYESKLETW